MNNAISVTSAFLHTVYVLLNKYTCVMRYVLHAVIGS